MGVHLTYFRALKPFGIKDYVKLQGFISDSAQETAIGGKFLRRLVEIVNPFTEGALRVLMESFITQRNKSGKLLRSYFNVVGSFIYCSYRRF